MGDKKLEYIYDLSTPPHLAGEAFASTIRTKSAELTRELIRQTLDELRSWHKAVADEWRKAHPAEAPSPVPDKELREYLDRVSNEYYTWVEPAFAHRLRPDPDGINPGIDALRNIEGSFHGESGGQGHFITANPALLRINDVRADMNHWQGQLQNNFINNFLTPLEAVSINQAQIAKEVRGQLVTGKGLYVEYRQRILDLLTNAIEAVKSLNKGRDPKAYTWGTLIGISAGTTLTLVPGFQFFGAALIVGATLAQGTVPPAKKNKRLDAPTAQEIATKVFQALAELDRQLSEQEEELYTKLKGISTAIYHTRSKDIASNTAGPFSVPTPRVSTTTSHGITDGSLRPDH